MNTETPREYIEETQNVGRVDSQDRMEFLQTSKTSGIKKCCFRKLQRTVVNLKAENTQLRRQLHRRDAVFDSLEQEVSVIRQQQAQAATDWQIVHQKIAQLIRETEDLLQENNELKIAMKK